jgi:hypothetical protein
MRARSSCCSSRARALAAAQGVVSNVLELRKLERGEDVLTLEVFNIGDAIHGLLKVCRMGAQFGVTSLTWVNEAEAEALPQHVEAREARSCCCAPCLQRTRLTSSTRAGRRQQSTDDRAELAA